MKRLGCALSVLAVVLLGSSSSAVADEAEGCAASAERAQTLRDKNQLRDAQRELLVCARASCPSFVRVDCAKFLQEVQAALPTIAIRALDARGRDIEGASAAVDGKPFAARIDGTAQPMDPGPHHVTLTAASGATVESDFVVASGEKSRVIVLRFAVPLKTDGTADVVATATPAPAPSSPPPSRSTTPVAAWILAGVSVAALGAGAVFEATGVSDWQSMRDGCARTDSCSSSSVDWAHTRLWYLAPASFAVAAIGGGLSAWLFLSRHEPTDRGTGLRLGIAPAVAGATAILAGAL
ncbi:MAG TPA: hypothetical protein VF765_20095 [Polyangiaceae bacterium]